MAPYQTSNPAAAAAASAFMPPFISAWNARAFDGHVRGHQAGPVERQARRIELERQFGRDGLADRRDAQMHELPIRLPERRRLPSPVGELGFSTGSARPRSTSTRRRCSGEIDRFNDLVYEAVNNGVYRAGFARSQDAYEEAYRKLFAAPSTISRRSWATGAICAASG